MKKIRVVQVVGRMDRAGQETFLMNILRQADLDKYEIWFSVNTNYVGDYEEEIKKLGGHIFHNPYPAKVDKLPQYMKAFRNFLRMEGPFDVVHCHVYYFSAFLLKIAYEERIPIRVMHSHNTSDGYSNSFFRELYRKQTLKMIDKYSNEKVACGVDAYEMFYGRKCPGDSKILNNAVVLSDYDERLYNIDLLKKNLNIPNGKKIFISVARFLPVKNHVKIIGIFEEFLNTVNRDALLYLLGDGPLIGEIKKMVVEKGLTHNVLFMGKRTNVNEFLMCSDIFLMPSLHEGLPVSLIEAQAAGVNCILSDTITKGIDMGLGLVQWCSLDDANSIWAEKCEEKCSSLKKDYEIRKKMIELHGYSLSNTWKKLEDIYDKKIHS